MQGVSILIGFFGTMSVPLIITIILIWDKLQFYELADEDERDVITSIIWVQALQLFFAWVIVFTGFQSSKKPEESEPRNDRLATYLCFSNLALTLYIMPLVSLILILVYLADGKFEETQFSLWYLIYGLT